MRSFLRLSLSAGALLLLSSGCREPEPPGAEAPSQQPPAVVAAPRLDVNGPRIAAADSEPANWLSYGRTYDEQRYSLLARITDDNVNRLGLTWSYDFDTNRGLEATPIVVDGVMFTSGSWSRVYADAADIQAFVIERAHQLLDSQP